LCAPPTRACNRLSRKPKPQLLQMISSACCTTPGFKPYTIKEPSPCAVSSITNVKGLGRQVECQRPWQTSLTVFVDQVPLGSLDNADQALLTIDLPDDSKILWRSFRRKAYLRFTSSGATDNQNGRFITCAQPGNLAAVRNIIINRQGRFRVAKLEKDVLKALIEDQ